MKDSRGLLDSFFDALFGRLSYGVPRRLPKWVGGRGCGRCALYLSYLGKGVFQGQVVVGVIASGDSERLIEDNTEARPVFCFNYYMTIQLLVLQTKKYEKVYLQNFDTH